MYCVWNISISPLNLYIGIKVNDSQILDEPPILTIPNLGVKIHININSDVFTFSQAVVVDRTMYISGQLGMDVASGQLVAGGVQAQTKQVSIDK